MKVLIPVDNLVIENEFELDKHHFFPAGKYNFVNMKQEHPVPGRQINCDSSIVYSGLSLRDMNNMATGLNIDNFSNITLVVTEVDFPNEGYHNNLREDDETLILKACEQVDRIFDFIRVKFCRMDIPVMNPGLPGLLPDGFSGIILIDPEDFSHYRIVASRFYGLSMVNGLGLELDSQQIDSLCNDNEFTILFDNSVSYASVLCKTALRRLSEAMYIPNLDSKFIYLMTTLETLASPNWIPFSKVKPRILPFIARSKQEYHFMSEELRIFSEDIRTEIVHNGKTLIEIRKGEYNKILLCLQSYIANFVFGVEHSKCKTNEELENFRTTRLKQLGIN